MQRVFLYAHGGAGNHGCEAIVRSTVKIFKENGFGEISLISSSVALGKANKFCSTGRRHALLIVRRYRSNRS